MVVVHNQIFFNRDGSHYLKLQFCPTFPWKFDPCFHKTGLCVPTCVTHLRGHKQPGPVSINATFILCAIWITCQHQVFFTLSQLFHSFKICEKSHHMHFCNNVSMACFVDFNKCILLKKALFYIKSV